MSTPFRENLAVPEPLRQSLLRAALRTQQELGDGELLAFENDGTWIELATVEDDSSPYPEKQRLTAERLAWIAQYINESPESIPIQSNIGSPDPTISAHHVRALPPHGFITAAQWTPPVLWGLAVQRVVDGVGQMTDAIENHGRVRRSLAFSPGTDPEGVNGWGAVHLALLGVERSGQGMLGMPDLEPTLFETRSGEAREICTRALELEVDEPEPAEPAAGGGEPAAEEEWTMSPEEIAALVDAIAAKIEPILTRATPAEPTPEERASAEADAAAAKERAATWAPEVTRRLDRCVMDGRLSTRDRPALITAISTMGREKGETEVLAIEARQPQAPAEPLNTAALSERSRAVLEHLPEGVRIEQTDVDRTLSYVEFRQKHGLKPGEKLTPQQAQELLAHRSREMAARA